MIEEFLQPVWLSMKIAIISTIFVVITGIMAAKVLTKRTFRAKTLIETILMLPLVLPPSVVGFLLIVIFGRNSFMGRFIEWVFSQPLIFTWWAAVIASSVVAFPLMYQSAKAGFLSVNPEIEEAAMVDGAKRWQVFLFVTVPLAKGALLSGIILSFTRALGEFGATLMFAGNIPGQTQTAPTAIYVALDSGNMLMAWAWVIALILISFLMLLFVQYGTAKDTGH